MAKRSKPTIKDIAAVAGVTHQAVSIALSDRPGVSDQRRKAIRQLAQEMGYYPHAASQMLNRSGRGTGQWGLLVASSPGEEPLDHGLGIAVTEFVKYCSENDQRYVLEYYLDRDKTSDFQPPHQVAGQLVDGMLVIGDVGDRLRKWLDEETQFPWVSMLEPARFCVLSAEHRSMYAMLKELIALGHRRIACPAGELEHLTHRLRFAACRHARRRFKLRGPQYWYDPRSDCPEENYRWAQRLLSSQTRPTAVICSGDATARTLILVAAQLGLSVPKDLSVITYASPMEARRGYPCLNGIHTNWTELTHAAVELLTDRINKKYKKDDQQHRWVLPTLFDGNSIAPPQI
jgi:DNA-binding LacI/PurR family transcriptional regulator